MISSLRVKDAAELGSDIEAKDFKHLYIIQQMKLHKISDNNRSTIFSGGLAVIIFWVLISDIILLKIYCNYYATSQVNT